jgi:nitroreductase
VIGIDQRATLEAAFVDAYRADKPEAGHLEIEAMRNMAREAPAMVVALFSPRESHIPLWEQELSCGAACMNLLSAATSLGFVASWITGWPAYSDRVRDAFGAAPERIAGFIYIGSPGKPLEERPRPSFEDRVSRWAP